MPSTTHYSLTTQQKNILNLLYRFRFATSDLLSQSTHINKTTINKRLKLMLEQEYIGRKYESEYHLLRKHATYFLLPRGIKSLKSLNDSEQYNRAVLKNIGNDKDASESFMNYCLSVFEVYCVLKKRYGDCAKFFTKSQLADYAHFPQPLPDAYVQLSSDGKESHFFFEMLNEHPFFLCTRKVMQYIKFANENRDVWEEETESNLPRVLLVCENASLQKRLHKKMKNVVSDADEDLVFYTSTVDDFANSDGWVDIAEPDEKLSFEDLG